MKDFKLIKDDFYKTNLLQNISKQKEISVLVHYKQKQFHARMLFDYKKGNSPYLICDLENIILSNGDKLQLSFFYKDIFFTFETAILEASGSSYHIQIPDSIHTSSKRMISRYTFDGTAEGAVFFKDQPEQFQLIDISTGGISFLSEKKFLGKNDVIRNIFIRIGNEFEIYTDAIVVHIKASKNKIIYGLTFHKMDWPDYRKVFAFIFNKKYPNLKLLSDFSNDEIFHLYEETRHISLKSKDDADLSFIHIVQSLAKIKNNPMLAFNLVYQKSGKLLTIGSAIRIYNRCFLGQPLLTAPGVTLNPKAKTDVYIGLADFILSHPYFKYYITYIIKDYEWHHDIFKNMNGLIHNRGKFLFDELQLLECEIDKLEIREQSADYDVMVLDNPEEFIRYCEEKLPPLEYRSFNYDMENFNLEATGQIYQILDYNLARRLWKINKNNQTAAFAVAESFQNDITINNMMDSCKIYLMEDVDDIEPVINSLLPDMSQFFRRYQKRMFNIMFKTLKKETKPVEKPGIYYASPVSRVLMNREGLSLYKDLMKANFEYYTKYYPLSHPQKGIWYIEKFYPNTCVGNISATVRLMDNVDYQILEKSINLMIEKNDSMRFRVLVENGEPRQYIKEFKYKHLELFDFSGKSIWELHRWDEERTRTPFQLIESELFDFALIKISPDEGGFFLKLHHLITDAWTMTLCTNQIIEYYHKLKNKMPVSDDKKPSYINYIIEEEEYKYSKKFEDDRKFWNGKFSTVPECMTLKARNLLYGNTIAERKTFIITGDLALKIYDYSKRCNISVYTMLLSILGVYIYRVTMKKDITIGTPVLNRSNAREKETTGMFISPIPVRIKVQEDINFQTFSQQVLKEWYTMLKHQKYPYEILLKEFREMHQITDNLYDVTISYQNARLNFSEYFDKYISRWHSNYHQTELLNIHITDHEDKNRFIINMDYLKESMTAREADDFYLHFINLLTDALDNPEKNISRLKMLSDDETSRLLTGYNQTKAIIPKSVTIPGLFEKQADKIPSRTAVISGDNALTYSELDHKANQLANYLLNKNHTADETPVGILMENNIYQSIAILGILKAGAFYIPLSPGNPEERIKTIINDAEIPVIISTGKHIHQIKRLERQCPSLKACLCIDIDTEIAQNGKGNGIRFDSARQLNRQEKSRPAPPVSKHNLAYIIYTSGTTGKPKGVMIEHIGLINYILWRIQNYGIDQNDVTLQLLSVSFDGFNSNFYSSILSGGQYIILNDEERKDMGAIIHEIKKRKVTNMSIVPSLYRLILENAGAEDLKSIRFVVTGGDKINRNLIELSQSKFPRISLDIEYGPTENSVATTAHRGIKPAVPASIGKPIRNNSIFILDANNNLMPDGITGELCVSGPGLARGYLNDAVLTNRKFTANPFIRGKKMYKTGDLARWLPDGTLEFMGRLDNQVKIRGYRIELEEIESALFGYKNIKEAAVISKELKQGESYLIAYYVPNLEFDMTELMKNLSIDLPEYMIPAKFIMIEQMPKNQNGKIDKKALLSLQESAGARKDYIPPRNAAEQVFVKIWEEVLGVEKIGINDNFFEMGGDSIKAIQITFLLQSYNLRLQIKDIFQYATIAVLSEHASRFEAKKSDQEDISGKTEYTPVQLWYFDKLFSPKKHFNQALMIRNSEGFNIPAVKKVFKKLVRHHDALRMRYRRESDKIVQFTGGLDETDYFTLTHFDLRDKADHDDIIKRESDKIQAAVNIIDGPLLRLGLFNTRKGDVLIIVIHHLIIDGISWRIILDDFKKGYTSLLQNEEIRFPAKTSSYKDWAERLKEYSESENFLTEVFYWMNIENTRIIPLPSDHLISENKYGDSRTAAVVFSEEDTKKLLMQSHEAYKTDANDFLIIMLGLSIKEWTGMNTIVLNIEGHGREEVFPDINISRTVGWFTTNYPAVLNLPQTDDLDIMITGIRDDLRKIPHKGFGYGVLKYLTPKDKKKNTDFKLHPEISFNYLGELIPENHLFKTSAVPSGQSFSKNLERPFKLEISGIIVSKKMTIEINYNSNEFDAGTMEMLAEKMKINMQKLLNHSKKKIDKNDFSPARTDQSPIQTEEKGPALLKSILLTGSTGFLGSHLLRDFIQNTTAKIYCLVRGINNEIIRTRFIKTLKFYDGHIENQINKRIFLVKGDISLPHFGMGENEYGGLGRSIGTVVHSAALVKHFGLYREFEKVNVRGAGEIAQFCREFNKRLFHISTGRVSGAMLEQDRAGLVFTENDLDIGQNYDDQAYVKSKFETERIVLEAMKSGVKAAIFRVGNLTGRYSDGLFQVNIQDSMFYNIIKSLLNLGESPEELAGIDMEFTPVDLCSRAISGLMAQNNISGKTFHLFNHKYIKLKNFIDILKGTGIDIKFVKRNHFLDHIKNPDNDLKKRNAVNFLFNVFNFEKLLDEKFNVRMDSQMTQKHLKKIGFEWPEIDSGYINKIINHIKRTDFLNI